MHEVLALLATVSEQSVKHYCLSGKQIEADGVERTNRVPHPQCLVRDI